MWRMESALNDAQDDSQIRKFDDTRRELYYADSAITNTLTLFRNFILQSFYTTLVLKFMQIYMEWRSGKCGVINAN